MLLISGAAGGVGSILTQLASKLTAATVVALIESGKSRGKIVLTGYEG